MIDGRGNLYGSTYAGGANKTGMVYTLQAPPTYSVSGQVTVNGSGLTGVSVSGGSGLSATTDASGNYTLTNVPVGTYTLTPTLTNQTFTPATKTVTVTNANLIGINFAAATYTVSGEITDTSGNILKSVILTASNGLSTYTHSNGVYFLPGMPAGTYTLTPTLSGYTFAPATRSVTIGPTATNINFTGTQLFSISGKITDSAGNIVRGVILNAGNGLSTYTHSDGSYIFSGLTAGTYTLSVSLNGYAFTPTTQTITVGPSATGVNFVAAELYNLSGKITDLTGNILTGVILNTGNGLSTYTHSNGVYNLTGLAAGTYTLTPTLAGYTFAPASQSVMIGPSQTSVNFTGTQLFTISGKITNAAGEVINGATIRAGNGVTALSHSNGVYVLTGLAAGTYTVSISYKSATFTPASQSVTVGPSQLGINFTAN